MRGWCTGPLHAGAQEQRGHGGTAPFFPWLDLRTQFRVTLPWGEGWDGGCTWSPSALRELQLSKSWPRLPCAVTPMQITQAECAAGTNPRKHGARCPVRLLQHSWAPWQGSTCICTGYLNVSLFGARKRSAVVLPLPIFSLFLLDLINVIRLGQPFGAWGPLRV